MIDEKIMDFKMKSELKLEYVPKNWRLSEL